MKPDKFPQARFPLWKHITYGWALKPRTIPTLRLAAVLEKYGSAQTGAFYQVFDELVRFQRQDFTRAKTWIAANYESLEMESTGKTRPKGVYLVPLKER